MAVRVGVCGCITQLGDGQGKTVTGQGKAVMYFPARRRSRKSSDRSRRGSDVLPGWETVSSPDLEATQSLITCRGLEGQDSLVLLNLPGRTTCPAMTCQ